MTKRRDVYTTIGLECGCRGPPAPTSDRTGGRAVPLGLPPAEGRDLNDAELEALYAATG